MMREYAWFKQEITKPKSDRVVVLKRDSLSLAGE